MAIDGFFAEQRTRAEQLLDAHVARVRQRLQAYEDDLLEPAERPSG